MKFLNLTTNCLGSFRHSRVDGGMSDGAEEDKQEQSKTFLFFDYLENENLCFRKFLILILRPHSNLKFT